MSVNTYLIDLASKLVLSQYEKQSVKTSINTISNRLDLHFVNNMEDVKIFGSYVRGTILPRRDDDDSDIDIMVIFKNTENYQPQTFLNYLKNFATKYYNRSEIYQSSPTIVLELQHIKFELTPAYISNGSYYIPYDAKTWQFTDPDVFYTTLTQCNINNANKIKPVVRLLKHWNIKKNNRKISSFTLEKEIAERMTYAYFTCSSYTDYLKEALNRIKYFTCYSEINIAIDTINCALNYEKNGLHALALYNIKKVFPEV